MDAPPVQYVTTSDGYSIAYAVSGEGPPLVLVPFVASHIQLSWGSPAIRSLYESLNARFRLFQYDSRGQGLSTRGLPEDHSMSDYGLDLEAVVDKLGLDGFTLFASAFFAWVAMSYAARNPQRVRALVLWAPIENLSGYAFGFDKIMQEQWEHYLQILAAGVQRDEETSITASTFQGSLTQADYVRLVQAVRRHRIQIDPRQILAPALVLVGKGMTFASEEAAQHLAALIPDARLVVFEDPQGGLFRSEGQVPPAVLAIEEFVKNLAPDEHAAPARLPPNGLSAREVEVLRLIAAGKSNQQIADELVISLNTVQHHVSNIFGKIGAVNRTEAASYAHRHGLV